MYDVANLTLNSRHYRNSNHLIHTISVTSSTLVPLTQYCITSWHKQANKMVDPAQPPNHNQNQGLIVTHAILMAIVTLLFGPWLVLSLHLQKSEGRRGPWSWPWFALMTLYGNMISGVTHGIIAGVRNGTVPHPFILYGFSTIGRKGQAMRIGKWGWEWEKC